MSKIITDKETPLYALCMQLAEERLNARLSGVMTGKALSRAVDAMKEDLAEEFFEAADKWIHERILDSMTAAYLGTDEPEETLDEVGMELSDVEGLYSDTSFSIESPETVMCDENVDEERLCNGYEERVADGIPEGGEFFE